MTMLFGIIALIFAAVGLILEGKGKPAKPFAYLSLSFTSLTVCSFYRDAYLMVAKGDYSGLLDTMPIFSKVLWGSVIASILINGLVLLKKERMPSSNE